MKRILILLSFILLILGGCSDNTPEAPHISSGDSAPDLSGAPNFSADNSPKEGLDYLGRYRGYFPCAGCDQTVILIVLKENQQFDQYVTRVGGNTPSQTADSGTFLWDESGTRIELHGRAVSKYWVKEDTLYQLGMDGTTCLTLDGFEFKLDKLPPLQPTK